MKLCVLLQAAVSTDAFSDCVAESQVSLAAHSGLWINGVKVWLCVSFIPCNCLMHIVWLKRVAEGGC